MASAQIQLQEAGIMVQSVSGLSLPEPFIPFIPVEGGERAFPVRRIWCVGRNYAAHAREMGADPVREPPFFFSKPPDSVVPGGGQLRFPIATENLHHEVELAVAIGACGVGVSAREAGNLIFGYAVALDMTRRDLQAQAKLASLPWDMAKGFDHSCPVSPIRPVSRSGRIDSGRLQLEVNGIIRQSGDLSDMIWSVEECIAALSWLVEIRPGDILLTGTPEGVGPVKPGDKLSAFCENVGALELRYTD
jgi:fumarylpyruvate hydrolase